MDPLTQYHTIQRASRASGYPNMQMFAPHPYEMSIMRLRRQRFPTPYPFAYQEGRAQQGGMIERFPYRRPSQGQETYQDSPGSGDRGYTPPSGPFASQNPYDGFGLRSNLNVQRKPQRGRFIPTY